MIDENLNLNSYDYYLPENLIAQTPLQPRDSSRLLVCSKVSNTVEHKTFHDIINYLSAGDVLVINNTKVMPSRLYGEKVDTKAKIELLLLKKINLTDWEVIVKPAKRCKVGTVIKISDELSCKIIENTNYDTKIASFNFEGNFEEILDKIGIMPLPPYIKQSLKNKNRYQTVYSKFFGSSAAPTAGLHFTKELLAKIKAKGVIIVEVLLHVGLGTFKPVSEENILHHHMHSEYVEVSKKSADIINLAKKENRKIIAVGTTSVRVLESCCENGKLIPTKKQTNIFIYPPYKFKIVDAIITNFHLPKSTLLMLVSAFIGRKETLELYKIAVANKYRFFSFGDAMLLM